MQEYQEIWLFLLFYLRNLRKIYVKHTLKVQIID